MQLFNFTGEQRVDTADLTDATNTAILGAQDDLLGNVLLQPGVLKVVSGFLPTAQASTGPVQVGQVGTPNVAFLGERTSSQVVYGRLMVGGQASQAVDITTFAAGTYTIFVRLTRLPDVPQNRTFWAALDQVEQARLTDTRLTVGWEVRLESATPSPEWFAIGRAVVTAGGSGQGNTVAVTDQRQMYFSGSVPAGGAPVWGTAADRTAAAQGGLVDLFTTLDALKSALVDIKGRGVAAWTSPNPVGMLVGPGFGVGTSATPNRLAVGDASFYLDLGTFGVPKLAFQGDGAQFAYVRSSSALQWQVSGQTLFVLDSSGSGNFAGQVVGHNSGPGYALSAVGVGSSAAAGLGITAVGKAQGFIEIGAGFGNLGYLDIVADWTSSTPTVTFSTQGRNLLMTGMSGGTLTTQLLGDRSTIYASNRIDLNAPTAFLNGRAINAATFVWASGVYNPGSNDSSQQPVTGGVANGQGPIPNAVFQADSGGYNSIHLNFPVALPSNAQVVVSGYYASNTGKVYSVGSQIASANTVIVGTSSNTGTVPENRPFTYVIFYGS